MRSFTKWTALLLVAVVITLALGGSGLAQQGLTSKEELGQLLYFEENLSTPDGMSCATCHLPDFGFVDPDTDLPVSAGVVPGLFGNRNAPSSGYAMYAPFFHWDPAEGLYIGGQFWDGRATGDALGDPLADQAAGPPLNPLEMHNPNKEPVVNAVKQSAYADLFEEVWGEGSLDNVAVAYDQIAISIAAFERSAEFAPFTSKYDEYLKECLKGKGKMDDCAKGVGPWARRAAAKIFTAQEWYGLQLFMGPNDNDGTLKAGEGALCSGCHVADWTAVDDYALPVVTPDWAPDGWIPPVFTDFTFDNLGVPKNPANPFYYLPPKYNPAGEDWVDLGLGGVLGLEDEMGKMKVMTLRNIGVTTPYTHNGYFATLAELVHFYNTRDVPAEMWPAPEVPATVNTDELGNLGLSAEDEAALVAFMETLTDARYTGD